MAYLREDIREDIRTKNRREVLDFLRCLTDRNNVSEHESLVIAWSLIGRHCGADELNLALIQLVDFLGHTHPVISGAAYHEILKLAEDLNRMPMELFKPFWSSVALHVVKDLIARPQRVQQLSELLGISVNDFLLLTQTETIPYLILTRRRDVLLRIAQARGPAAGVQDLWLQPSKNLAAVISLLFIQPSPDPELAAIGLLKDVAPDFTEHDLSNLVRVDPILIACAILKEAAVGQDAKRVQVSQQYFLNSTILIKSRHIKHFVYLLWLRSVNLVANQKQPNLRKPSHHSLRLMFSELCHISRILSTRRLTSSLYLRKYAHSRQ